jgi:hypothetical protein
MGVEIVVRNNRVIDSSAGAPFRVRFGEQVMIMITGPVFAGHRVARMRAPSLAAMVGFKFSCA